MLTFPSWYCHIGHLQKKNKLVQQRCGRCMVRIVSHVAGSAALLGFSKAFDKVAHTLMVIFWRPRPGDQMRDLLTDSRCRHFFIWARSTTKINHSFYGLCALYGQAKICFWNMPYTCGKKQSHPSIADIYGGNLGLVWQHYQGIISACEFLVEKNNARA